MKLPDSSMWIRAAAVTFSPIVYEPVSSTRASRTHVPDVRQRAEF